MQEPIRPSDFACSFAPRSESLADAAVQDGQERGIVFQTVIPPTKSEPRASATGCGALALNITTVSQASSGDTGSSEPPPGADAWGSDDSRSPR
jgi:hypothetical protein